MRLHIALDIAVGTKTWQKQDSLCSRMTGIDGPAGIGKCTSAIESFKMLQFVGFRGGE